MNLGAFAIVAFLRNVLRSEEIVDYAGLAKRSPGVAICFSIILFSLLGLPPLAGFAAKFAIFASLVDARLWLLVVVGGLNTAISLIYYLRVVRVMTLEPEPADRPPLRFPMLTQEGLYVLAMTVPVAGLLFAWEPLKRITMAATSGLF
jgi:NADH-quinone oxidoreductase subunit N